ncbi:MAG: hypothetical protein FWG46_06780 [Treponema sp.]|nr:hypothetical protein [Treponema sp.]
MAFDKNGINGSAEELETYGVWVKSEPQDMVSGFADAAGFGGGAMPYVGDFVAGFEEMGVSGIDLSDLDGETSRMGMDDFHVSGFDDDVGMDEPREEMSSQILLKIADELSTIRSELTTLKMEFADIRAESGGAEGARSGDHGGFFEEEEDEKIALTGDEMDSILTSADFSENEEPGFDSRREKDAAALRKLSEQNEAVSLQDDVQDVDLSALADEDAEEEEEIEIDFDELGIDLDNELAGNVAEEQAAPPDPEDELKLAEDFFAVDPLEEIDEIRDLRLEGADHIEAAPNDTSYLDEYPFALGEAVSDGSLSGGDELNIDLGDVALRLDEASFGDGADDLGLDGSDIGLDAASLGLDEVTLALDEAVLGLSDFMEDPLQLEDDFEAMDLSGAVIEEPDLSADISDPPLEEPDLGEISLDLDDIDDFESAGSASAKDSGIAQVIPEGFELDAEDAAGSLDDDLDAAEDDIGVDTAGSAVPVSAAVQGKSGLAGITPDMISDLKNMLTYMDHLLESLPEEKIEEFAKSEFFDSYKKIFKDLGIV